MTDSSLKHFSKDIFLKYLKDFKKQKFFLRSQFVTTMKYTEYLLRSQKTLAPQSFNFELGT